MSTTRSTTSLSTPLPPNLGYLNRVRAYFSSASGGFGMRLGYDRRLQDDLRVTAGAEMLTYGLLRSADILGADLPPNVTRITLVALPFGLQQHFSPNSRVIPHVGFGAGPVLRFDHRPQAGLYPNTGGTLGKTYFGPANSVFVESGVDIRVGSEKDLAITLAGRYPLTRFSDAVGNPGDFNGFSLAVGLGKYF